MILEIEKIIESETDKSGHGLRTAHPSLTHSALVAYSVSIYSIFAIQRKIPC